MFSRLVDNARAFLTRSPSASSLPQNDDDSADMVTTRRGNDTNSPLVTGSVTRSGLKRVLDDNVGTPTRTTKKRKSLEKVEQPKFGSQEKDGADKASGDVKGDDAEATEKKDDASQELTTPVPKRGRGRAAKKQTPTTPMVVDTPTEKKDEQPAEVNDSEAESVYDTPESQGSDSVYATPATTLRAPARGSAKETPQSAITKKSNAKPAKSTPSKLASQDVDMEEDEEPTPKAAPVAKSTHIRFASEDPPAVPSEPALEIPSSTAEAEQEDVEEESDDEAPEAVSAGTAREQAKAAEAEAAKAKEREDASLKRKRQDRDARLREQAEAAKRRKAQKDASSTIPEPTTAANQPPTIPALLPLDLLAAAPETRPLTPPPTADPVPAPKKNKITKFADEKPAKDVKRGPVRVRVLEKANTLLPPKASASSRDVREAWLAGRRGGSGKGGKGRVQELLGPQRKKVGGGGGFLRR